MLDGSLTLLKREITLSLRQGIYSYMAVVFFILVITLFPLGLGPYNDILALISPAIIWIAALLASILSFNQLFISDYEDGSLELLFLSPAPAELLIFTKIFANWITTGLPLIIASPFLAILMNMPSSGLWCLLGTLALGTPTLSLIGAVGTTLTLGSSRGGVLLPIIVLPLFIPILIFGVSAVDAAIKGNNNEIQLLMLFSFLAFALLLCPWISALSIRQTLE